MVLIHTEIKHATMVNMLNVSTGWTKLVRNLELVKFSLKINKEVRRRKKNKERIERKNTKILYNCATIDSSFTATEIRTGINGSFGLNTMPMATPMLENVSG